MARLIDSIDDPSQLRMLPPVELSRVAAEIRKEIINTVSRTGGHLAPSLGAVELAVALHYTFDTPRDVILWDVGHQAYAHKILTGRLKRFSTLRQLGGLSGFPNKDESPFYDLFTCGHSSTSISSALGLAVGRDLKGEKNKIVVVIGDASLAGGMAFEAMNHTGHMDKDLIVILNDNELSISQSVGALSRYLNRIITNPAYNKIRKDVEKVLKRIPRFGFRAYRAARKLEEGLKNLLVPGMLFEELGFRYFGPIDGHNITHLVNVFKNVKDLNEPILIHVITKKGKGYKFAEERPSDFHGTGPFVVETGEKIVKQSAEIFTDAFGNKIVELAAADERIIGITAAMVDGTGFNRFAELFPTRFFDVGIAEEHAITFGAGLSRAGFKPVIAMYSTFLQRGYDQILHDICLQNLPIIFCLDRAGIVGEDGPTHHGIFDISYLRHMPNMVIMAPRDPDELRQMLEFAVSHHGPIAIRYPKGAAFSLSQEAKSSAGAQPVKPLKMGTGVILRQGKDVALIAVGSMVNIALEAAYLLSKKRVNVTVIDARFIKPLDAQMLEDVCRSTKKIVTLEENVLEGGFGSAVLEFLERENIRDVKVKRIGLPDKFTEHGRREEIFLKYNLTPDAICDVIIREVV